MEQESLQGEINAFIINDYVPLLEVNSKTVITWPIVRNRCFFFLKNDYEVIER